MKIIHCCLFKVAKFYNILFYKIPTKLMYKCYYMNLLYSFKIITETFMKLRLNGSNWKLGQISAMIFWVYLCQWVVLLPFTRLALTFFAFPFRSNVANHSHFILLAKLSLSVFTTGNVYRHKLFCLLLKYKFIFTKQLV